MLSAWTYVLCAWRVVNSLIIFFSIGPQRWAFNKLFYIALNNWVPTRGVVEMLVIAFKGFFDCQKIKKGSSFAKCILSLIWFLWWE